MIFFELKNLSTKIFIYLFPVKKEYFDIFGQDSYVILYSYLEVVLYETFSLTTLMIPFSLRLLIFYHEIPKTSSYWFGWSVNDDWQSQSLSHVVVLNPGPLDWLSIALTTRPLLHVLQSLLLVPNILIWVSLIKPSRKRSDVYFHVMQLFVCVFFQAGWLKLIHNIVEGGIICGACV